MAAQEDHDSLPTGSPITAAALADRSESTTLLVSEGPGSCLPRVLQQAFEDGGARPPPLALLAQVLQSIITGHEIPVSNLSDPTSEAALVYLITRAIIDYGSAREEVPQIPNSWHPSLRRTAATALATLLHALN